MIFFNLKIPISARAKVRLFDLLLILVSLQILHYVWESDNSTSADIMLQTQFQVITEIWCKFSCENANWQVNGLANEPDLKSQEISDEETDHVEPTMKSIT